MKRIKSLFIPAFSITACLCMGIQSISPVAASEKIVQGTEEIDKIILEFNEIQDNITDSLIIEGDHYVYNEDYINSLFFRFDINKFNEVTGGYVKYFV